MAVSKVIKRLLFTFNFLFFVVGIIIFSYAAYVRIHRADYQVTDQVLPAINLLIFIGAVTLILGFLGFCGAIRESSSLLSLFSAGLLVVLLVLLAVGALGVVSRTAAARELVKQHVKQLLPLSEQPQEVQESFQKVERTSFCCGFFVGHLDWGNSTAAVPDSCNCTDASGNCTVVDGREIYSTPCMTHIMTWLDRVSGSVVGTAVAFGILMIVGIILSSGLNLQIKRRNKGVI